VVGRSRGRLARRDRGHSGRSSHVARPGVRVAADPLLRSRECAHLPDCG
jgi:hypothetical protein